MNGKIFYPKTCIMAEDALIPGVGIDSRIKYVQLANYITRQIETGQLAINDQLPSVNQLTQRLSMSKETVLKGLNQLSELGIIESVYRKGYYVRRKQLAHPYRIFFLLDKLTPFKDKLYHSFFEAIRDVADVDVYFHHHNYKIFEKLINENLHNYTHYVITTFIREDVSEILNRIPPAKRIILDYNQPDLTGNYAAVYQDFSADIQMLLEQLLPNLKKYKRLVLVVPHDSFHGNLVKEGFETFCRSSGMKGIVVAAASDELFTRGDVYITPGRYDVDEVEIIKLTRAHGWQLGKEVGLISYNDTEVKEVLENGITVISTDFSQMGEAAVKMIIEKKFHKIRNASKIILRNSL